MCVLAGQFLAGICTIVEVQGYEDGEGASSPVTSPRIAAAASQLSPVFEDRMRPHDDTAGVQAAQYSRGQQPRSTGNESCSHLRTTGQGVYEHRMMLLSSCMQCCQVRTEQDTMLKHTYCLGQYTED